MAAMSADDLNAITDPNAFRKAASELGLTVRVTSSDGQKRPYRRKPDIVEDYRRQLAESQCQNGSACGPDMQVDEQVAETASNPSETPPTGRLSHSQDFVVGGKRCAICCTPCRTGLTVADGCPGTVCSLQCKLRANDRWIEAKLSSPDASASAATSGKSASSSSHCALEAMPSEAVATTLASGRVASQSSSASSNSQGGLSAQRQPVLHVCHLSC